MIEDDIKEFWELFPDCPNLEHFPKTFEHYVKMFYYLYK